MHSNESVFKMCVEKGWILTEMIPFETKLEDIFRELTMN
jgi:ABC-2 type transport system ATP-binding protein